MEAAKTLIRTTVRTFFPHPKQILVIDALLMHSVLHIDDLVTLLSSQPKDIRSMISPLRGARLLSTHSRTEARVGSNRGIQRDYYYVNFHETIDAIKFRIAKLRRKVESLYQQDATKRKDWRCPRCKSEYDELTILDKVNENGFYCDKCNFTLVQNEAAAKESGSHEKIRSLNTQLAKFDDMIAKVDRTEIPENDFATAWERKTEVPRELLPGQGHRTEYVELKRDHRNALSQKRQEIVNAGNLAVNLTTSSEKEREDAEAKERRKAELAKMNQLPEWHTKSAIGIGSKNKDADVKVEDDRDTNRVTSSSASGGVVKTEDDRFDTDEEKPAVSEEATMQDEVAAYLAEMERERLEAERRAREEEGEEDEDEDDEDEFEDVVGTGAGTPMSSSQPGTGAGVQNSLSALSSPSRTQKTNGLKRARELDFDGDSASGTDTNTNTPLHVPSSNGAISSQPGLDRDHKRDVKRTKLENGVTNVPTSIKQGNTNGVAAGGGATVKREAVSDDDEDDDDEEFEDV